VVISYTAEGRGLRVIWIDSEETGTTKVHEAAYNAQFAVGLPVSDLARTTLMADDRLIDPAPSG